MLRNSYIYNYYCHWYGWLQVFEFGVTHVLIFPKDATKTFEMPSMAGIDSILLRYTWFARLNI